MEEEKRETRTMEVMQSGDSQSLDPDSTEGQETQVKAPERILRIQSNLAQTTNSVFYDNCYKTQIINGLKYYNSLSLYPCLID